ncbi:aspartate--tRNA(Asn) ligase [Patescibacteria group bacterium]|nr:MAG: aspartate--tRNA(Asn) ligase [Patescibacteria group bacterium]
MLFVLVNDLNKHIGSEVRVRGWTHKIRKLGGMNFLMLRDRTGVVQAAIEGEVAEKIKGIGVESVISVRGKVVKEDRAPGGVEIKAADIEIVSKVSDEIPLEINKKDLPANIDTVLEYRPIALRHAKEQAIFMVQAEIAKSFADFFKGEGFTQIFTPKLVAAGAEGGAGLFKVDYFDRKAFLGQSPQLYKQIMVGVFERVFEIGHVYRAEEHNTSRHLNEVVQMDIEMGFIDGQDDVMDIQEEFLKRLSQDLKRNYSKEFEMHGASIPEVTKIPRLTLEEVQKLIEKEYKKECRGLPDLDPEHEKMICEYMQKQGKGDYVFVTHFPAKKKPFYLMDDAEHEGKSLSFDLLFRGIEISSGGQRNHLYDVQVEKFKRMGYDPENFKDYLSIFKYGMPPHGGWSIGLERITMKMLGLSNVRQASLFPRDRHRLTP